jgi:hypothetical protein
MFLRNASRYPDGKVRSLVEFAVQRIPVYDEHICVTVQDAVRYPIAGWAYRGMAEWSGAKCSRWIVEVNIGKPQAFPCDNVCKYYENHIPIEHPYGGACSPVIVYQNWREAVVGIAAHELHHIYQFQNKLPGTEIECERQAERVLKAYRARQAR